MDYNAIVNGMGDMDIIGELLNDVDISGDPALVLESLGALPPGQASQLAAKMGLARKIDPQALAVRQQILRRYGIQGAGCTPVTFLAGGPLTQQVELRVSRPFKPEEIIIPSSIAPFFVLDNIQVNGVNQLASSAPVPAEALSEAALRPKMKLDTVNPSFPLTMDVTMTDTTADRVFRALFVGPALLK